MRTRQLSAAAGLVAALGLTLTACGSDAADGGAAKSSAAPAASASTGQSASAPAGQPAAPASATPDATAGSAPAAKATNTQAGGAAGGSRKCTAADLKAAPADGTGAQTPDDQGAEEIELTNTSGATCTMKGYPGVDLVGPRGTWNLVRAQGAIQTVTLQPGGRAYIIINYLPFAGGGGAEFKVQKVVLTPPDDTSQLTVQWSGVNPADQSGATHPVTYVRPVSATR
ncbi:DUF4232 domain-containing protein [Kitasatospora sp. NPDC092948]|uniref:DUF4232 domain-containing protein n=1 Tax=Kitasatospora sp. NPDC092948 TaxID=3364088 RepID=UPI0038111AB5